MITILSTALFILMLANNMTICHINIHLSEV